MNWFKRGPKKTVEEKKPGGSSLEIPPRDASMELEHFAQHSAERAMPTELADLFLVMEEHLNELELDDIRVIVSELQQPPALVDRLTHGLDDPEELHEAILSSPSLSADVLRVVNSAAFALANPISSIEHAVTYLGTTMVKGLVLQSAVTQVMTFETDVQKAAYTRIWKSSYVASTAAHIYAQALNYEFPSILATRALLCNVGDLALISARPELSVIYAPKTELITRVSDQQREFMANSAVLSSLLARHWGLPDDLYDALRHALTPLGIAPQDNQRSREEQREDVIVYLAGRVGDAVAYRGVKDIEDFELLEQSSADFFHLPDYLRQNELGALVHTLNERKNARRLQQVMNSFSG
ncbi:MAG: hypothetical protein Cons2KO_31460 [Congregibacter sp.]